MRRLIKPGEVSQSGKKSLLLFAKSATKAPSTFCRLAALTGETMKYLLFIIAFIFSPHGLACSFAQMTEEFKIEDVAAPVPAKPKFVVKNIERGFFDRNRGSCSDAGSITLEATNPDVDNVGYIFRLSQGSFEDEIFQDAPVTPSKFAEHHVFTFIWFDGHSDEQEPIDMVVEITPVSKSGGKGEPAYLQVSHPGKKSRGGSFGSVG